jgi:hypothetical protein
MTEVMVPGQGYGRDRDMDRAGPAGEEIDTARLAGGPFQVSNW